jgi:hypothetical protein
LSRLKGYFVEDSPRTTNRNTNDTEEDQYKSWTTAKSSNPIHSAWIFQAYLRQVAALAERIELSISCWTKDRSESNGDRTTSELEELRTDMLGQLSNIGESWGEAINEDGWLQTDAAEEKKALARTVHDARSWGQKALRKIREFRDEATAWRRHNDSANLQYQEWEGGADAEATHIATVSTTGVTLKQKQSQLRNSTTAVRPDMGQTKTLDVAEGVKTRSVSRNGQNTQLSKEKLRISQQQEVNPERGTTGKKLLKMPAEIRLIPRTGKKPFMWSGPEFDMSMI